MLLEKMSPSKTEQASIMKAQFKLSPISNSVFINEKPGDVLIYPTTSNQNILMGNMAGRNPVLTLQSNAAVVGGSLTTEGGINTNLMQATGLFLTPYDPSQDPASLGSTVAPMYIPMNSSGPFNNALSLGSGANPENGGLLTMDLQKDTHAIFHLANSASPGALTVSLAYNGDVAIPATFAGVSGTMRFIEHSSTGRVVHLDSRMTPATLSTPAFTATTPSYGAPSVIDLNYNIVTENIISYTTTVQSFAAQSVLGSALLNAAAVSRTAVDDSGVLHFACVSDASGVTPQSLIDADGNVIYQGSTQSRTPTVYRYDQSKHLIDAITTDLPCNRSFTCLSESGKLLIAFTQDGSDLTTPVAAGASFCISCTTTNILTGVTSTRTLLTTTHVAAGSVRPGIIASLNPAATLASVWTDVIAMEKCRMSDVFADPQASLAGVTSYADTFGILVSPMAVGASLIRPNSATVSVQHAATSAGGVSTTLCVFSASSASLVMQAFANGTMDGQAIGSARKGCVVIATKTGNATGPSLDIIGSGNTVAKTVLGTGTSAEQHVIVTYDVTQNGLEYAWNSTVWSQDPAQSTDNVGIDVDGVGNVFYSLPYTTTTPVVHDGLDHLFAIPAALAFSGVTSSAVLQFDPTGTVDWYVNAPGAVVGPRSICAAKDGTGCVVGAVVVQDASVVSWGGTVSHTPTGSTFAAVKFRLDGSVQWLVAGDDTGTTSTPTAAGIASGSDGSFWISAGASGASIGKYTMSDTLGRTVTYANPLSGSYATSAMCLMQRINATGSIVASPSSATVATASSRAAVPAFANRILNGAMQINEMGYAGLQVGGAYGNSGICAIDRWQVYRDATSGYFTVDQMYSATALSGFPWSLRLANTASGSVTPTAQGLVQTVSGRDLADLGWESASDASNATLSFWCKLSGATAVNNSAGSVSLGVVVRDVACTAAYATLFTVPTNDTWKFVTVALPPPSVGMGSGWSSTGLTIAISLAGAATGALQLGWSSSAATSPLGTVAGQGDMLTAATGTAFHITGVQLQVGSPATSFEFRPYTLERYLNQDVTSASNVVLPGKLTASNVATFASNVSVYGPLNSYYNAVFSSNLTVLGSLNAETVNYSHSNILVWTSEELRSNITIDGKITASNYAFLSSNLTVQGNTTLSNTNVTGVITASNVATFAGAVNTYGTVSLSNMTNLYGVMSASNAAVFAKGLTVAGAPVTLSNAATVYGVFSACNYSVFNSNVGIGTMTPAYPCHITSQNNNVSVFASYDIAAFSDRRVKTDIRVIPDALTKIDNINGYTFLRTDDNASSERQCGLIAQELVQVLPEAVHTHPDTGMMSIAYGNVVALILQGLKELHAEVTTLTALLKESQQ